MRRIAIVGLALGLAGAAPLRAELKCTMHVEARKSTVPPPAKPDPLIGLMVPFVAGLLLPAAPLDIVMIAGPKGVRTEYSQPFLAFPAGAIAILRPEGGVVVLNPAEKTYWKAEKVEPPANIVPKVLSKRTGEIATIAGSRAEKIALEIRVPVPLPDGLQMPPGFPAELLLNAEVWVSDAFKSYSAQLANPLGGLSWLGIDAKVLGEGIPLRAVIRGEILGNQELEYVVTKIGEETVEPTLFEIPEGYKEVPPPTGRGIGGGAAVRE